MVVGELIGSGSPILRFWRERLRLLIPVPVVGLVWWLVVTQRPQPVERGLWWYAAINALLLVLALRPMTQQAPLLSRGLVLLAMLSDLIFGAMLLRFANVLGMAIYPIYLVLSLKVFWYRRHIPAATTFPFLLGAAYFLALYVGGHRSLTLNFYEYITNWGLVFGSLGIGAIAVWTSERNLTRLRALSTQLEQERKRHAAQLREISDIADGLRQRMREQYALRESLRAVSSTLSRDDVLIQIVDSAAQMLASARASGTALTLCDDHAPSCLNHIIGHGSAIGEITASLIARRVIERGSSLLIDDTSLGEADWPLASAGVASLISTPLFGADGELCGALTVTSSERNAFSHVEARYLDDFGLQASVAIRNADLHDQVLRQEKLLAAVVRDIADGLLVLDQNYEIVLQNAVGRALIDPQRDAGAATMRSIIDLVQSLSPDGAPCVRQEIVIPASETHAEQTFQAFASLVVVPGDTYHTAIVLHDISHHKAQERLRADFVAMVSHELRNPLHSLNGFLKLVLQGRAGALTPRQREFLDMVDEQVELLKGRISELLEFNRLDNGRLNLTPEQTDLPLVLTGVVSRLSHDVEKAGLQLCSNIPGTLPELFVDAGRVGQVVTNLVENAIKATAPGGSITISATEYADEVRVMVSDTGVGIPADEQTKIFDRYHRVHHKASHHGAHLGLGLSICQQIVEGHGGRIWVESEVGKGSTFIFSLPITKVEISQAVGDLV